MNTSMQIGFSQRIQLDWLEHTAALVLQEKAREQIAADLQAFLSDKLSVGGTAQRSNREKTITILLRIWVSTPPHLQAFRDDGLQFLQRRPLHEHLAVHWGMTMAVYPFFSAVAEVVGHLVRLQGTCAAAHVQRRVREQLGERETVARAARRIVRCFVDWGVMQETQKKGIYQAAPVRPVFDKPLVAWLTEAALITSGSDISALKTLIQAPALFPFRLTPLYAADLDSYGRLGHFRQSLDEDMVTLCSSSMRT